MAKPMRRSSEGLGSGAVDDAHVMQRHLAGLQFDRHRLRRIDVDRDLLAARQQVVLRERVAMRHLVEQVGAAA